jgi:hypothetical protein
MNGGRRLVPRGSVHHHDRVPQSRSPCKPSKCHWFPLRAPFCCAVGKG